MKGKNWLVSLAVVIMLLSGLLAADYAWAGEGDGSGGGQNNPLTIVSTFPADGATGVSDLEFIKFTFSKNVVYMTVRENNQKCFSLWNGDERIPVEIIMADDQIEREKRHDIIVKPKEQLQAGTTYRVEVAPQVESKSGVTLGKKATINFTMAGEKVAASPVKDEPAESGNENGASVQAAGNSGSSVATDKDNAAVGQEGISAGEAEENEGAVVEQKLIGDIDPEGADKENQNDTKARDGNYLKTAGILILVAVLAVFIFRRGLRKTKQ